MSRFTRGSVERALWVSFGVSFALLVVASVLPVRPLVGVFPAWGVVALAGMALAAVASAAASATGWPATGGER